MKLFNFLAKKIYKNPAGNIEKQTNEIPQDIKAKTTTKKTTKNTAKKTTKAAKVKSVSKKAAK